MSPGTEAAMKSRTAMLQGGQKNTLHVHRYSKRRMFLIARATFCGVTVLETLESTQTAFWVDSIFGVRPGWLTGS